MFYKVHTSFQNNCEWFRLSQQLCACLCTLWYDFLFLWSFDTILWYVYMFEHVYERFPALLNGLRTFEYVFMRICLTHAWCMMHDAWRMPDACLTYLCMFQCILVHFPHVYACLWPPCAPHYTAHVCICMNLYAHVFLKVFVHEFECTGSSALTCATVMILLA